MKRKLLLTIALLVLAIAVALIILTPRIEPDPPLPNPNGYDDFVKAASLVSPRTGDWPELELEELRAVVATNRPALALIRTGLTKQCRVVPFYTLTSTSNHLSGLGGQKTGAQAFCAASRLALMEGRTNDAALLALDCVRYGSELSRGGPLIDALVGMAIRTIGLARLKAALPGTDAVASRKIASTLQEVAARSETFTEVYQREGRFGPQSLMTQLTRPFRWHGLKPEAAAKFNKSAADLRQAATHAAACAYELDHGKPPAAAIDLVPDYLKSVPLDPATGKEMSLN